MLEVQIENIIPVTEARDKFNQIVDAVENTEELYVLTKNGKPAAIVVGIHHLEKLTGETHSAVFGGEKSDTAQEVPAPIQQFGTPASTAPADAPYAAPTSDVAPTPTDNFSAMPQAPAEIPQPSVAPDPAAAITFDSMPPQTVISPVPVSIPQDANSTSIPIDSPLIDTSATASAGEAIAPDAVTPDQAGPSADPFAIPSEPLDLPEDTQVQAAPATVVDNTQNAQAQ